MAIESVEAHPEVPPSRAWWLRVPATLLSPRSVFFALREEDDEDVAARAEPILLVVWLAGAASFLMDPLAGRILDDPDYDAVNLAIWFFIGGGITGAVYYFVVGLAVQFGAMLLGSQGSFTRQRQLVAFAAVPLALSFVVLLPLRLALFGGDTFHAGGADEGAGETVITGLQLGFAIWSLVLVAVGVRVVHGWGWARTTGALAAAVALLVAIVGVLVMV